MSVRPLVPRDRPIHYKPERRRNPRNGRDDPRRGPVETLADDVAQTVYVNRLGLYLVFITTLSLIVQVAGTPWEWFA